MNIQQTTARVLIAVGVCIAPAAATHPHGDSATEPSKSTEEAHLRQGAVEFDAQAPAALEVKAAKTGHLLVRPVINGHEAGWYIFDTGAGVCVVSTGATDGLGLTDAGELEATGVGGAKSAKLRRAADLSLGAMHLKDVPLMETDLSFLEQYLGEKISGVVGYAVLSRCVAEMDLKTPAISLREPAKYTLARGEWTGIELRENIPVIDAVCEGHPGKFRLDTGDHSSIIIHAPAVEKYAMLEGRETKDIKLGGVGGMLPGKRGIIKSLTIGGRTLENVEASFALERKGSFGDAELDGNIGGGVLKQFLLVTDYTNSRLALVDR